MASLCLPVTRAKPPVSADTSEKTDQVLTDRKIPDGITSAPFAKIEASDHVSESRDYDDMWISFDADVRVSDAAAHPVIQVKKQLLTGLIVLLL